MRQMRRRLLLLLCGQLLNGRLGDLLLTLGEELRLLLLLLLEHLLGQNARQ